MFKLLRDLIAGKRAGTHDGTEPSSDDEPAPSEIAIAGAPPFPIRDHLSVNHGFPLLDGEAVDAWVRAIDSPELQAAAWGACEHAWLLHFRDALGPGYRLLESDGAVVLSALPPVVARAALEDLERALRRVVHVLGGIAEVPQWGKDILIVFDAREAFLRYLSCYYPDLDEVEFREGTYIYSACTHFVAVAENLRSTGRVYARALAQACLRHLPLPVWLSEGIADNAEQRIAGGRQWTPEETQERLAGFWDETRVQTFWSGESFLSRESSTLSFELAQAMVAQLASEWEPFKQFVLSADSADGGAAAAHAHLGVDLGEVVCALIEAEHARGWAPRPDTWQAGPQTA